MLLVQYFRAKTYHNFDRDNNGYTKGLNDSFF